MKNIPVVLLTLFSLMSLSGIAQTQDAKPPKLNREEREAIITVANEAFRRHIRSPQAKQREFSKECWGEEIEKLNPVRVLNDIVNVFIVLQEDERTRTGFYVNLPISSYIPGGDNRFLVFEKLSREGDNAFGILYWCKVKKPEAELKSKED